MIDEYGCLENSYLAAIFVHVLLLTQGSVAVAINLGQCTMFHFVFTDLAASIPPDCHFDNGAGRGIQMSIDRHGSYGLPKGAETTHYSLMDKWGLGEYEAKAIEPFYNTILTGKNCFNAEPPEPTTPSEGEL